MDITTMNKMAEALDADMKALRRDMEFLMDATTWAASDELSAEVEALTDAFAAFVGGSATMSEVFDALDHAWSAYSRARESVIG